MMVIVMMIDGEVKREQLHVASGVAVAVAGVSWHGHDLYHHVGRGWRSIHHRRHHHDLGDAAAVAVAAAADVVVVVVDDDDDDHLHPHSDHHTWMQNDENESETFLRRISSHRHGQSRSCSRQKKMVLLKRGTAAGTDVQNAVRNSKYHLRRLLRLLVRRKIVHEIWTLTLTCSIVESDHRCCCRWFRHRHRHDHDGHEKNSCSYYYSS